MNVVIEKIRALRALAASSTHEREARAAARQAARLAERHRIAEAEIEAASAGPAPEPAAIDEHPVYRGGAIPGWKKALIAVVATHFGCAVVHERAWVGALVPTAEQRMLLVGRRSDIELARETIGWLMLQIAALCQARAAGRGKAYRAAWSLGCVAGIRDQLTAGQNDARAEAAAKPATSTALVRLDARLAEAKAAIEDLPRARADRRPQITDHTALAEGRYDGRRMPITASTTERRPVRGLAGAP